MLAAALRVLSRASLPCLMLYTASLPALANDEGKPAPQFDATFLDGTPFKYSGGNGKVVIIKFWASWCEPCREEMPLLQNYYQQHQAQGLQIIAISMDDPADDAQVRSIMRNYSYPAAFKRDSNIRGFGRIWRMPMTFVIDRAGILRKDGSVGEPKIDAALLEKVVTPLLATGATQAAAPAP